MPVATTEWFNTSQYPVPLLILFGVGCFGWVVAYVAIVESALRNQFFLQTLCAVTPVLDVYYVWLFHRRRVPRAA